PHPSLPRLSSTLFPYTTLFRSLHHFAQRDQTRADDAIEGSLDFRVAEVERGLRGIDLGLLEPSSRGVAIGRCVVERPFRCDLARSEEHTSELQSRVDLVCRLLL